MGEMNLPLTRSIIDLGHSKAITLPISWIKNAETEEKRRVIAISLEVDGSIILKPIFEEKIIQENNGAKAT
jgi:hypothetical protein